MRLSVECSECGERFPSSEVIGLEKLGLFIFLDFDEVGVEDTGAFTIYRNGIHHSAHSTGIRRDGKVLCIRCLGEEEVGHE